MDITPIHTKKAPKAIGPYSQAIQANGFIFISGQLPLEPSSMTIEAQTIEEQAKLALKHIEAILEAAGASVGQIVKVELFLANMSDFEAVNKVYGEFFDGRGQPARQAFEVSKLPKNALIEISCIAYAT